LARIRILGASGSGTSTLGTELAGFFWLPTDPPFTSPRPIADRQRLLLQTLPIDGHWVFSGAATRWAMKLEPYYDLVVFLHLDPVIRMARLRSREQARYGARLLPGGDMAAIHAAFIAWAEAYDTAGPSQRSLAAHQVWLADQPAPVLRLNSLAPVAELVVSVHEKLKSLL
jgi:hypothetical protein